MNTANAETRLRTFVATSLRNKDLTDEDNLFEVGEASSLFATELVLFIEQDLGLPLADDDIERDNFSSIGKLVRLIEQLENRGAT